MNALSINYTVNFLATCENTLERYNNAQTDSQRKAILDRQTLRGIGFAIDFVKSLNVEYMTDRELNHAIRCCYFRGVNAPKYTI